MHRIPGLDLLRATAIVSVICTHAWVAGGMGEGFGWIQEFGWMGVDLFFVLSGYLIGRQVLMRFKHEGHVDLKGFYRQRAYRILPAYLTVVGLYFGFPSLREQEAIQPLWQFLTFTMNLFVDQRAMHAFSSAWSLCVEEHFYLIFPVAVMAIAPRANVRRLCAIFLGVVVFGLAWRGFAWWQSSALASDGNGQWEMDGRRYMELIYYPSYARLDGLLAGVALAVLSVYRTAQWERIQRYPNVLALLGAATVGLVSWVFRDTLTFAACVAGFPILSLGLALLVVSAASPAGVLAKLRVPGASWMAAISYSIYLSHKAVLKLASKHLPASVDHHGILTFACCALVALVAAAILHYLVERPFLWLRDRAAGRTVAMAAA
ncbi:acyltransferase family protein [Dyella silvatica]|uniref:acyltransferase family protein n=1 Tax=Dyella silvatica TaxID=2992128 RepID=UPI002251B72A|nr:acyltransferase [Dyella silvatica]